MIKYVKLLSLAVISLCIIASCSNDNGPNNNTDIESIPIINSISADKTQIMFGGEEAAVLTCTAKGGNLKYIWQVDLGDLIPLNAERSKVSFSGAACCVGEKIITCTVSNNKGSVSDTIRINIIENITTPEIITIESEKPEINSSTEESTGLVCYALGGNLKYAWEADCGNVVVNQSDNSKITYTATAACIGNVNIKCTVTNDKGTFSMTYKLIVK
jgi:hypothetical protein